MALQASFLRESFPADFANVVPALFMHRAHMVPHARFYGEALLAVWAVEIPALLMDDTNMGREVTSLRESLPALGAGMVGSRLAHVMDSLAVSH